MLVKLIKDPLFHFICLGSLLFVINAWVGNNSEEQQVITIDQAIVDEIVTDWNQIHSSAPDQAELEHLIEQRIRQEVLFREAERLQLDKNDPLIRQRLAQKALVMNQGFAQFPPADKDTLRNFYQANTALFKPEPQVSFQQIFIDPLQHQNSQLQAKQWINELNTDDTTVSGDASSLQREYQDMTQSGLERLFGEVFTRQLLSQPSGTWVGPIQSQYGLHLVNISHLLRQPAPPFETIEDDVALAYQRHQRQQADEQYYQSLRTQYQIQVTESVTGAE
ncbi:peptidyl-prolyl cis-trans isomerase [Neptunicella sp. SCSIO 80796]|uniref:peptidylprolyl isomerase n=1 Tax=Neptunicella plasticusilytica TaxID=3117012 RepID=UPI003A4D724E